TAVLPLPANRQVEAPRVLFESEEGAGEERKFQPLATQRHYVLFVNQSESAATPLQPGSLDPVDRQGLPIDVEPRWTNQAMEIGRRVRADAAPAWRMDRPSVQKGLPAYIGLAELTTVVERGGSWRTKAVYRIKNFSRQFLAIDLPQDSELL